jgi:2'-5' RNA ligase
MDIFGFSLWIIPPEESKKKFEAIIQQLAAKYQTPVFVPHVELLGEIPSVKEDIIEKTTAVTKTISPFPLTLTSVNFQDTYLSSLYIQANSSDELAFLHTRLVEEFAMTETLFFPHLSLMHSNLDSKTKEEIITSIGREQPEHFTVSSLFLAQSSGDESTWKVVHEFPLLGVAK